MPDDGCRAETERVADLEQAPADVDIVSRDAELRVESAHVFKGSLAEGHIAARNVLGVPVGDQHVSWRPGRICEAIGDDG